LLLIIVIVRAGTAPLFLLLLLWLVGIPSTHCQKLYWGRPHYHALLHCC